MSLRDIFSDFKFFDALSADVITATEGDTNGNTIDLRGFGAATVVVQVKSLASAGAMNAADKQLFILQHGLASAAGVSAWSNVPNSLLIHSVYGGYGSTGETGIFVSLQSSTDVTGHSEIFFVGYKGDASHRYLRVVVRNSDAASTAWAAAAAILGMPESWAVNSPV